MLKQRKTTVLHGGEGKISTIKWRHLYIAWANDSVGILARDLPTIQYILHTVHMLQSTQEYLLSAVITEWYCVMSSDLYCTGSLRV